MSSLKAIVIELFSSSSQNQKGWENFVNITGNDLHKYINYYLNDQEHAADILQEVYIAFLRHKEIFCKICEKESEGLASKMIYAWLYKTARNKSFHLITKMKKENSVKILLKEKAKITKKDTQIDYYEKKDAFDLIKYELVNLNAKQQNLLTLKFFFEKSNLEIANEINCELSSIPKLINRALEQLKKRLDKYDLNLSIALIGSALTNKAMCTGIQVKLLPVIYQSYQNYLSGSMLTKTIILKGNLMKLLYAIIGVTAMGTTLFFINANAQDEKKNTITHETKVNFPENSLAWLARHQEKDGHWASVKHEGPVQQKDEEVATTALALCAFLGAGHTETAGKYKENVRSAISWLALAQTTNGSWHTSNYTNGICTFAIAEAIGMSCGGPELKKSADLAVEYLLKQQTGSGGFSYSFTEFPDRDDLLVTGFCIMGLKSALLTGIKQKEIEIAFNKCSTLLNNIVGSKAFSKVWYENIEVVPDAPGSACLSTIMLIRQFLGWKNSEKWLQSAGNDQILKLPSEYKGEDIYLFYFTYLALNKLGGKQWENWKEPVSKMLISAQSQDGDFKGSWGKTGSSTDNTGRVKHTALISLCIEIYFRSKY